MGRVADVIRYTNEGIVWLILTIIYLVVFGLARLLTLVHRRTPHGWATSFEGKDDATSPY